MFGILEKMDKFSNETMTSEKKISFMQEVINNGQYELLGLNGETYDTWRGPETPGYSYIFTVQGNSSKEHVFEIICRNDGLHKEIYHF